ncbi:MAG: twin-arginine translocation signal domain-containing protein [Bryobacterales bacterium]|nr:twin-arginine translocation signal domain-containing protein [Bryobacterales bacterium]
MPDIYFSRRGFLHGAAAAAAAPAPAAVEPLPSISIGPKRVSRLIVGSNPIGGYSYGPAKLTRHMLDYFTVERTAGFLLHCERQGINTFQGFSSPKIRSALLAARERGSRIQFILLASGFEKGIPADVRELDPVAICHHGGVTDTLFRSGKHQVVHDFVKRVRDAGIPAGVSMHNPDNLARIEDSNWENDFYMACFYYLTRTPEELARLMPEPTVELALREYIFFAGDPERMARRIRETRKPCLAFKILGAGRHCKNAQTLENAFAFAFRNIKPVDGVIVGMYPALSDEAREDADFVRTLGRA